MGVGAATMQSMSAVGMVVGYRGTKAHLTPQPIELRMMQPEKRVIRREAYLHTPAIFLRQDLWTVPCQVAPNKIVYMVVHECHCELEPEEVACRLLRRITHKVWPKGQVLR